MGEKSFSYYAIPKEPGEYNLGDYFSWIYFDPRKEQYDTLRSDIKINVSGESFKNTYISSNDLGSFYNNIPFEDNTLISLNNKGYINLVVNVLILFMVVVTAIFMFKEYLPHKTLKHKEKMEDG